MFGEKCILMRLDGVCAYSFGIPSPFNILLGYSIYPKLDSTCKFLVISLKILLSNNEGGQ